MRMACFGDSPCRGSEEGSRQASGSCRLLAPLSRQRLPSGMGCTGAPIIEVLRDAGPFDGFCLTSAACPECVKSHGTEPQARIRAALAVHQSKCVSKRVEDNADVA